MTGPQAGVFLLASKHMLGGPSFLLVALVPMVVTAPDSTNSVLFLEVGPLRLMQNASPVVLVATARYLVQRMQPQ